ncbi:MAG: holin family protein [Rickettsiales bacterium]
MLAEAIVGTVGKVLDKVIPDPVERDKAKAELIRLQQDGEFREMETAMKAITAEAQSSDPWTSRARPLFMYVFYFILLAQVVFIPAVGVFFPRDMENYFDMMAKGFAAIPEPLWWTFTAGYLGYTGARTYEKKKIIDGKGAAAPRKG